MDSTQRGIPNNVYPQPPNATPHSPLQHLQPQQSGYLNPSSPQGAIPYSPQMQQMQQMQRFPASAPPADPTQVYYAPGAGQGYHALGYVEAHHGYGNPIVVQQPHVQYPLQAIAYNAIPYSSSYPPPHQYHPRQQHHQMPVTTAPPGRGHYAPVWSHGHAPHPQQQQAQWQYYSHQHMPPTGYGLPAQTLKPHLSRISPSKSDPALHTSYPISPATTSASGSSSVPSLPRGPPRKPKKSGNGLWVGNLPPGTSVAELKEYFAEGAKTEIQSVYLISKSNCAFINYRSDQALLDAMQRFHDSRFKNTRLVCRTQRPEQEKFPGASAAAAAPSMDHSPPPSQQKTEDPEAQNSGNEKPDPPTAPKPPPSGPSGATSRPRVYGKDRYFILKSLTVEDMEFSVKNGIWATQGHNETTLNQAFETAENVYLIFSANKSGEYYGYARMASQITRDSSAGLPTMLPSSSAASSATTTPLPKAIPTPETDSAPKGCIYDDSARGTIFWEADQPAEGDNTTESTPATQTPEEPVPASAGIPFRVQWLSTQRLPFYRCRNLRNPWNANREVKVARDGTELETALGQRLVSMFHRPHPPQPPPQPMGMMVPA